MLFLVLKNQCVCRSEGKSSICSVFLSVSLRSLFCPTAFLKNYKSKDPTFKFCKDHITLVCLCTCLISSGRQEMVGMLVMLTSRKKPLVTCGIVVCDSQVQMGDSTTL